MIGTTRGNFDVSTSLFSAQSSSELSGIYLGSLGGRIHGRAHHAHSQLESGAEAMTLAAGSSGDPHLFHGHKIIINSRVVKSRLR
jgi:hypothetical protein